MKLTPPPVIMPINTVRLLCSLAFSVLCSVFVRVSFPQNLEKLGHFILTTPGITENV